jgi:hypothetical protein
VVDDRVGLRSVAWETVRRRRRSTGRGSGGGTLGLQVGQFAAEVVDVGELAVDGCEADVGDLVHVLEELEDVLADLAWTVSRSCQCAIMSASTRATRRSISCFADRTLGEGDAELLAAA